MRYFGLGKYCVRGKTLILCFSTNLSSAPYGTPRMYFYKAHIWGLRSLKHIVIGGTLSDPSTIFKVEKQTAEVFSPLRRSTKLTTTTLKFICSKKKLQVTVYVSMGDFYQFDSGKIGGWYEKYLLEHQLAIVIRYISPTGNEQITQLRMFKGTITPINHGGKAFFPQITPEKGNKRKSSHAAFQLQRDIFLKKSVSLKDWNFVLVTFSC